MARLIIYTLLFISLPVFAQDYLKQNEKSVLEFKTTKGKKVVVALDKNEKYLVYRFGTQKNIEFAYPENGLNSWNKFKFSYYTRGGGSRNEGIDLNYLYFENNQYRYVVFQEYISSSDNTKYGIKVINRKTEEETIYNADSSSVLGTLIYLRNLKPLIKSNDLF